MRRLVLALISLLAPAAPGLAQGFMVNTLPLEGLMDQLQASDDELARYKLRAFYTIAYYDPPDLLVPAEIAKLETLLADQGACRNETYTGVAVWDALIGFFQAHRMDDLLLRRIKAAGHTLEVVSRGWDGVSGSGAECSVGVYRVYFDIGKYMTLNYDFRAAFGPAPATAWWESP